MNESGETATLFTVPDEQFDELQRVLDEPARDLPRLRALLDTDHQEKS